MSNTVYAGAVAPESLVYTATQGTSGINMTTVSAASLRVTKQDGTFATWAATISNATTTQLTLTHVFSAGDVTTPGQVTLSAVLTVPGGTVRTTPQKLFVLDPDNA